jgi:transposase
VDVGVVIRDARRPAVTEQTALRRGAAAEVVLGQTRTESAALGAAATLGTSRRARANWCRRNASGGDAAVAARPRGWPGEEPSLSARQELDLVEAVRRAFPDELGLAGRLWTRQAVADLIERAYDVRLTAPGVNRYLRSWGLGPREPVDRACGLCADAVARWLDRDYPAVERAARASGAQLCWVGRTKLCGLVPAADVLSAAPARGGVRFMIAGRNDAIMSEFLARLAAHEERAVHTVADGSWAAAEWPRRAPRGVVLHALPSCARG